MKNKIEESRKLKEAQQVCLEEPLLTGFAEHGSINFSGRLSLVKEEAKKQIFIAWPIITMSLLRYSVRLVSTMFVGHLGELPLSGASVATSLANVFGFNVLIGMASALETLCGQAYGAKQYPLLGVLFQRAVFILSCVAIPLSIVCIFMQSILIALGQDPAIANVAGQCAIWMIPSFFAFAFLLPLMKFLQAQSIVMPLMFCSAIVFVLHVPICWVLVFKVGLGTNGAALANSISYWVNVVVLMLYCMLSPACKKTWSPVSRNAFKDIQSFINLAIPSTLMICLEYFSFEIILILSGLMPKPELQTSVTSISLNTIALVFMIPTGFSAVVSTRVSNELGAGAAQKAKLAVQTVISLTSLEVVIVATIFVGIRKIWAKVFSSEAEVIDSVSSVTPILAIATIVDGIQCVLSGVCRGCGWLKLGAYANLVAYYIVGIPLAVFLGFSLHFHSKGLWLGLICGLTAQAALLSIITAHTNWSEQERKARERVDASTFPISDSDI